MKKLLIFFLFAANSGYAQSPFLKVYSNNILAEDNEVPGYFLPVEFKFEFDAPGNVYQIKEGTINYYCYSPRVIKFDSNYVHTGYPVVGDSVVIIIRKLAVSNKKRKNIDTLIQRTIKCKREYKVTSIEKKAINNNPLLIHLKDQLLDPNEEIPNELPAGKWTISLDKAAQGKEIIKSEVILVRGKRPVRTFSYTSRELDLSIFFIKGENITSHAYPGDFLLLRAYTDDTNYLPKIIEIK